MNKKVNYGRRYTFNHLIFDTVNTSNNSKVIITTPNRLTITLKYFYLPSEDDHFG